MDALPVSTVFLAVAVALPLVAGEPLAEQKAVLDAFARHTVRQKAVVNEAGHVLRLAISNHGAFWKKKPAPPPEPMPEELFRQGIVQFPHLEAVAIEKQKIGDASYGLLGKLQRLRDVRLHYMDAESGATRDAPLFINDLPLPLEVLEIKHNFSIRGGCMAQLEPQPDLRKLELDTGYAGPDAVAFIVQSPRLTNLQIHRTTIGDAGLQRILHALPDLEVLLIRPSGQKGNPGRITGRSLRGLRACPKLRHLVLGIEWQELPYEGGLAALAGLPLLEQVSIAPSDVPGFGIDHPAVQRLHEARPDILIRVKRNTIGGKEGQRWKGEDADWNWDGGVTTHG